MVEVHTGDRPAADPQKPENFGATLYHALGIPWSFAWHDRDGRPYPFCAGGPFPGLVSPRERAKGLNPDISYAPGTCVLRGGLTRYRVWGSNTNIPFASRPPL